MKTKKTIGVVLIGMVVFAVLFCLASGIFAIAVYLVCNVLLPVFGQDTGLSFGQSYKAGLVLCFLGWLWNLNRHAVRKARA